MISTTIQRILFHMRLHAPTSLLCVVDIQERLLAAMPDGQRMIAMIAMAGRLADAATLLGVRSVLTEQYPKGLGHTPPELAAKLPPAAAKMTFSCCGCPSAVAAFPRSRPHPRRVDGSLEMLLRQQPRHSAVTTRRVLLLLHYSSKLTH